MFRKKKPNKLIPLLTRYLLIPALSALIGGIISYGFFVIKIKRERTEVQDVSIYTENHDVTYCFEGSKVVKFNPLIWRLYQGNIIIKNTGYADLSIIPVECIISGYITGKPHIVKEPAGTEMDDFELIKIDGGTKLKLTIPALRRNQSVKIDLFYFVQKKENPSPPLCELEKAGIRIRNLRVIYK